MGREFELARGVSVADVTGVSEGYEVSRQPPSDRYPSGYGAFTVSVSAPRIERVFLALAELVRAPAFLVLEVPSNKSVEDDLRRTEQDPYHKDVHYLDGIDHEVLEGIWRRYREFIVHDGMLRFGFGSHDVLDEVLIHKYKVFSVLTTEPEKHELRLSALDFPRRDRLHTVWDNFTPETPGRTERIEVDGRTIYEMVEELAREGLHFAERRED